MSREPSIGIPVARRAPGSPVLVADARTDVLPGRARERCLRSKFGRFALFCNSRYLSRFAAFVFDGGPEVSIAAGCIRLCCVTDIGHGPTVRHAVARPSLACHDHVAPRERGLPAPSVGPSRPSRVGTYASFRHGRAAIPRGTVPFPSRACASCPSARGVAGDGVSHSPSPPPSPRTPYTYSRPCTARHSRCHPGSFAIVRACPVGRHAGLSLCPESFGREPRAPRRAQNPRPSVRKRQ